MQQQLGLFEHLTHKANLKHTRYGWLRLTPAYSVHLVDDLLSKAVTDRMVVLDPFCGTGTTALVCSERGIVSDTIDINPFLLWLAKVKTQSYSKAEIEAFLDVSEKIEQGISNDYFEKAWFPPIHQIEKWWDDNTLRILSGIMQAIRSSTDSFTHYTIDLLKIAFCRVMINHSSASFNHQSMSFKKQEINPLFHRSNHDIVLSWRAAIADIANSAQSEILIQPNVFECDARHLHQKLPHNYYNCIITSPPYPNRMSYIRELRPYMYWLGFLHDGKEAGELDWKAIGGTWGIATSNVGKWLPSDNRRIPYDNFNEILRLIAEQSIILSKYVHKYFYDMVDHVNNIFIVTQSGGSIHYIVGNSKFYEVMLPVEELFASLFADAGFKNVTIKTIRKRTSKKELYEYIVSATKP